MWPCVHAGAAEVVRKMPGPSGRLPSIVQRIVEGVDVTNMVAVLVDAGFIRGDAAEGDAARDVLTPACRASRSARTPAAQAAARASTSPWQLFSG